MPPSADRRLISTWPRRHARDGDLGTLESDDTRDEQHGPTEAAGGVTVEIGPATIESPGSVTVEIGEATDVTPATAGELAK